MRKAIRATRVRGGHAKPESDDEEASSSPNDLSVAASAGQTAVVGRLLAQGAYVETKDKNGFTPLHLAALN
jgi:ankyrin repeat protein